MWTRYVLSILIAVINADNLWSNGFNDRNDNLLYSGTVSNVFTVVGLNPCPDIAIFPTCINVEDGGSIWMETAVDTSLYHHITLSLWMNINGLSNNEYCNIYYSIDNSLNWIPASKRTNGLKFYVSFELSLNASSNQGIRIMFENNATSSANCYLSNGNLDGILITNHPTMTPTLHPTKQPTVDPSNYPTNYPTNPTIDPTMYPTKYPTFEPTNYPSFEPTYYPTKYPTKYPTNDPSNGPTIRPTKTPTLSPLQTDSGEAINTTEMTDELSGNDYKSFLEKYMILFIIIGISIIICCILVGCMFWRKIKKKNVSRIISESTKHIVSNDGNTDPNEGGIQLSKIKALTITNDDMHHDDDEDDDDNDDMYNNIVNTPNSTNTINTLSTVNGVQLASDDDDDDDDNDNDDMYNVVNTPNDDNNILNTPKSGINNNVSLAIDHDNESLYIQPQSVSTTTITSI